MPPSHAAAARRRSGRGNKGKRGEETEKTASPDPVYRQPDSPAAPPQQSAAGRPSPSVSREQRQEDRREGDLDLAAPSMAAHPAQDEQEMESAETMSVPPEQPLPSRLPLEDGLTSLCSPAFAASHSRTGHPHSPLASSSPSSFSDAAASKAALASLETPAAPCAAPVEEKGQPRPENPPTDSSDGSYILLEEAESQRACVDRKTRYPQPETDSTLWAAPDFAAHATSFASGFRNALLPSSRLQREAGRSGLSGVSFRAPSQSLESPGRVSQGRPRGGEPPRRRQHWRRELRTLCAVALAFLRACWVWMKRAELRASRWISQNAATVRVVTYAFLLLVTSTGNTICFKKMIDKLPNYSPFLTQVTTVAFVPVFFALSFYTDYAGGLPQEMAEFPKRNFAVMGSLDSFSGILAIIGAVHTTGTTQVVLQQSCIVFILLASIVMLRKRFHVAHYLGAAVIILGVLVVKLPDLLHPSPDGGDDMFVFNLLYLLSNLPVAISCVYKEMAFRGVEMGANYLQAWVALFQFLIGFLILPLNALPVLGPQRVPLAELPASLWNGTRCLFGYNTIVTDCGDAGGLQSPCDDCEGAWKYVGMYLGFNLLYNMFIIFVVKNGGAALTFLVSTLRLPVTALAFCSQAIMGDRAVPPRATDFYGLLVLILGLVIYRAGGIMKKRAQRRALAAARRHPSPSVLTLRGDEEDHPGADFVEEVFAACEVEEALSDDEETDDDNSEIDVRPLFTSVIPPEPPQVYVHTRHHSHGDGSYHKLPASGSSPTAFTPFIHRESGSERELCTRRRNREAGAGEKSSRLRDFPLDEETGHAGATYGHYSPPALHSASPSRVGGYEPPTVHVVQPSVVGRSRSNGDPK
uniref:Putative chloroquine resistance transporter n=1 Tax=Neospora caninum (strain Liverpool) TaxID=572307 RepID=A0A0F7UPD6_NEOCL|nr:TPA: Putative chloroquine resistance transporter [Neospora caninum Liverpool]